MLLPAAVALALSSASASASAVDPPRAEPVSVPAPSVVPAPTAVEAPAADAPPPSGAPTASRADENLLHAPAAMTLALGSTAPDPAEGPSDAAGPPGNDPFQSMNREFFNFNQRLDRTFVGPTARAWKRKAPGTAQSMLHNFVTNFGEPVVMANDILQLRPKRAMSTAFRFIVNTTAGIGGLFDPARRAGVEHHDNDFGITLGRYGAPPGPYLYIPLMGPSSVRDALGAAVDGFIIDPWAWAGWVKELEPAHPPKHPHPYFHHHDAIPNRNAIRAGMGVLGAIDERARVDEDLTVMMSTATDPYATMRSVYLQNRAAQVNQARWTHSDLPDFDTPADTPPAQPAAAATPASASAAAAPETPAAAGPQRATPVKAVLPARND